MRVVVAMSGGVDSAVAAARCVRAGHEVIGISLRLARDGTGSCCSLEDFHDARAVAERLGIPHYVLDYEARFKEAVIDRFAASYAAGETPVPCVECNRSIKFADLLGTARELGAQVLATGHYVVNRRLGGGTRVLHRAHEAERDQSYFLFATTRAQLDVLRFPLGGLPKARVRELAREFDLAIADKQDSQDICFVPTGRYGDVIERLRPGASAPGDIVDLSGRVLGRHDGIIHFTVGQRKGLGIAAREPLYVLRLEAATRRVVVGSRAALGVRVIHLHDVNWIGDGAIDDAPRREVFVKVRSTRPPQQAWLSIGRAGIEVELLGGEAGVAPGQACVFYDAADGDARVLGGGFIRATQAAIATPRESIAAHA